MALIKPPLLTFREKNPNLFQLQLLLADQPIVPTDSLVLKIELRADQEGKVLKLLTLEQADSESNVLSVLLPDLPASQYYVNLVVVATGLPEVRSGLCQITILPIGSLATISDVQGLTATLDQTNTIVTASLDSSSSSTLAAVAAELSNQQAQQARDETILLAQAAEQDRIDAQQAAEDAQEAASQVFVRIVPPLIAEGTTFITTEGKVWLTFTDTDVEGLLEAEEIIDEL